VGAAPREAAFYETRPGGRVLCTLCPHRCNLASGYRGACGVRVSLGGRLYTLVYDRVVAAHVDPIEKKPLFHFLPGSRTYSIATVGCCLRCAACQNSGISQWARDRVPHRCARVGAGPQEGQAAPAALDEGALAALCDAIPGEPVTPRGIVEAALGAGCASIAYTYSEPTVFFELAYDTAVLARRAGLRNLFVTCGYVSPEPLRRIATVLDAVNVDLKFFRDESYRRSSRGRLAPVLDAVRLYHDLGVWTEVTTLVVPGLNDSDEELGEIAAFIRSVGEEVPWHVTRFHPAHRLLDRPATPAGTLRRARRIGLEAGLRYVYEGNVPGEDGEHTHCHACGARLITRLSVFLKSNRIRGGRCPGCGARVDGVEMDGRPAAS
jgi:pyruvate formate lyase activating enzyme